MPFEKKKQASSSKKKDDGIFGGVFRGLRNVRRLSKNRGKEVEDIVTGIPAGAFLFGQAIDRALPKGPLERGKRPHNDSALLRQLAKEMAKQTYADIRHPTRNPTSTALTLLGLASVGSGTAARGAAGLSAAKKTGSVGKGLKAATGPQKPPIRRFAGIPKKPGQIPRRYEVDANRNPLGRALRRVTLDPAYNVSKKRAERNLKNAKITPKKNARILKEGSSEFNSLIPGGIGSQARLAIAKQKAKKEGYGVIEKADGTPVFLKESAKKIEPQGRGGKYAQRIERRTRDEQARFARQRRGYDPNAEEVDVALGGNTVGEILGAPMNAVRASMYVRPRYVLQNMLGTSLLLASQHGSTLKAAKTARKMKRLNVPKGTRARKEDWSDIATGVRGTMGSSGAKATAAHAKGPLDKQVQKMASIVGKPEEYLRDLAFYKRAQQEGITSEADLRNLLSGRNRQRFSRVARGANEAVIDYARLGPNERKFMSMQLPIFYPMTKNFTRYAAKFPTEHSIQAAVLAQLGQEGNEFQKESLGGVEPPPWAPYMFGTGGNRTLNPQNIFQFSPGLDVGRQTAQGFAPGGSIPGLNLLQQLGPLGQILYASQVGKELESGFDIKQVDDDTSNIEAALQGFMETSLPFGDIANAQWDFGRKSKTYEPMSLLEQLGYNTFGPPLFPRRTRMNEVRRQSKQAKTKSERRRY